MVLLNVLVKPTWLLMEMKAQDLIGHDDWGMYAALLSFGFLFITLSDLGVNYYATKTLAGQPELMKSYFSNLLTFKIFITLLYPFAMVGAGWMLGYTERELYYLMLLCLVHGGSQLVHFFRANFQAMQRFKIDGIFSVLSRILLIALVGILFLTKLDVDRFVYARLAAVSVTIIVSYLVLIRLYGWMRPRMDMKLIGSIAKQSIPFALMTVLYSLHDKVDQVMLERMLEDGKVQNGLYVAGYRWLDAFSMYLWTVLPIFFARFAFFIKDQQEQEKLLHFGQKVAALPMILVSVFIWFHGDLLLFPYANSTPEQLEVISHCLKALFVAGFFNGIFAIFSTILTSTGYEKVISWMVSVAIVLNVVLNWIFIPTYGAIATAWTTVASYVLMDVAYIWYLHFYRDIQVPFRQIGQLFLVGGLAAALFWGCEEVGLVWYISTPIV
ncbi:MAG: oligosaccharide flippase family protein, partial [Bacteroidota bacterium]